MCNYCEEVEKTDELYSQYGMKGDHYIAYRKKPQQFELWSDDDCSSVIQFCPWCGRKLELSDDEVELSAKDEIARLEERINHTDTVMYGLVDHLALLLECSNGDTRYRVLQALRDIRGEINESC